MAATATELHESNEGKKKNSNTKRYLVQAAATIDDAYAAVEGVAPTTLAGGLVRQQPDAAPIPGFDSAWFVTVEYGTQDMDPFQRDEQSFSLDMTQGTARITQAKSHMDDYAAAGFGVAPNHGGAINVTQSSTGELSVEGVDLPIPSCNFTRTIYVSPGDMTNSYLNKLYSLKGCYNNATWTITTDDNVSFIFAAGEVTYLGSSMQKQGRAGNWPVVQNFRAEINLEAATIGPFTNVDKLGADYIWFEFVTKKDPGSARLVSVPAFAHVERVADPANFDDLEP